MTRPLHIGCSRLTNTIYAGSLSKDGTTWLANRTDVTKAALIAVAEHIGPGFVTTLLRNDGGPSLEIEVREVPATLSPKGHP